MAEQSTGLLESTKRLFGTVSAIISTRLELLSNELEEALLHMEQMFLFSVSVLFCFGLAVLLLTAFIVVLFWDNHRLAILGSLSAIFFVLGVWLSMLLRSKAQAKTKLFTVSLAELTKDREELNSKS